MSVQPGWYKDPADPSTQRYWDGDGWIGAPLPADATPPPGPPTATAAPPATATPSAASGTPGTAAAGNPAATGIGGTAGTAGPPPAGRPHPGYVHPVPAPRPRHLPLAPLGARLAARLIDIGILLLLTAAVNAWFVWQWVQEVSPLVAEARQRWMAGDFSAERPASPDARADNLLLVILLITAALWFAYEVPALANGGQTVGKRLMGVQVVSIGGQERLGFGRALRRWNTLGLPVFLWSCCGIGLLLQLVDCAYPLIDRPLRQALHDKRAQTVVVRVPRPSTTTPGNGSAKRTENPGGSS